MSFEVFEADEALVVSGQELTEVEVQFVEGAGVWRTCPVDGTRYFIRSESYPLGRPEGARWCSDSCEALARGVRVLGQVPAEVADEVEFEGALIREEVLSLD